MESTVFFTKMIKNLDEQLENLRTAFETRVDENEANLSKSTEERKRIAAENRTIRTESIEPLRKCIQAFQDTVFRELA